MILRSPSKATLPTPPLLTRARHIRDEEIRQWLARSASEFTYTIEMVGATKVAANRYVALHHLEGNFPGGRVDLQFRFTLRGGEITQLTIEE